MNLQLAAKKEFFKRQIKTDIIYVDLNKYNYFLLEGGRGGGKTHRIARLLLFLAMQRQTRIFCGREIQATIKESVYAVLKNIIIELNLPFRIMSNMIIHEENNSEFIFKGFREQGKYNIQGLEDIDILWIEEAQAITAATLDVILPTIRKKNSKVIFTMNRFLEKDPVYEKFNIKSNFPKSLHLTMNYLNNEYLDEKMLELAEQEKRKNYPNYLHIWMGEPQLESDEKSALSLKRLKEAVNRDVEAEGGLVVGVDVARFGKDRSTMYKRQGFKTIGWKVYKSDDLKDEGDGISGLVKLANYCEAFVVFNKESIFNIDDTGVGGGLTDILRSRGYTVNAVNNGAPPKEREINKRKNRNKTPNDPDYIYDKYDNVITEMFFEFSDILDKVSIPDDDELLVELSQRHYSYTGDQKKRIESKEDFKKRYLISPDKGDGFLLCYYTPAPKKSIHFMVL